MWGLCASPVNFSDYLTLIHTGIVHTNILANITSELYVSVITIASTVCNSNSVKQLLKLKNLKKLHS